MTLSVLLVAFPFAPVGPDAVGGAEQVLAQLELGLARLGHRTAVVAAEGSATAGPLFATPLPRGPLTEDARRDAQERHRETIARVLRRHDADLVHMHGFDFHAYRPPRGVPVLVTLHLPPAWYPPAVFSAPGGDTWLVPVSDSQRRACPPCPALLAPVANGVPVNALDARLGKRRYAIALGRICAEKNFGAALDAGSRAGMPVLLGGQVFPYPEHEAHFRMEIAPRLARGPHRFLGALGFARKRRLLAGARCLLFASLAPETSCLVAMEALASGTPIVAFPSGALTEVVEHGVTGFLVRDVAEMAEAIHAAARLDPEACRAAARRRFGREAMVGRYLALYRALLRREAHHVAPA
jgi:glycosyltransferase involved in cell wall biosynthesis